MKHLAFALALFALLLAGCSSSPAPTVRATATPAITQTAAPLTPGLPGAPGCNPPSSRQPSAIGLPEVQATSAHGSLWLLLFGDTKVGVDLKNVWRMTGTGDLHLLAIGPRGQRVSPDWGPEAHGGSNWNRPGDEWGAGFTVPVAGCWDLRATRDNTSGDAWLVFTK
jgi:hypothetical protein